MQRQAAAKIDRGIGKMEAPTESHQATANRAMTDFKEALIKSTCADLRQKFLLTRKKIAGILTDFKIF